MSITLYGFTTSRSFRCLWALEEAQLDYHYIEVDKRHPDSGFLALNPQGKVPTLLDNDKVITESGAIVNYIDSLCEQCFIPQDRRLRAQYDEINCFVLTELEQPLWTIGKHRFALPEKYRVSEIFPTAQYEFEKANKALNTLIHNHRNTFVVGEQFTFADIMLGHTYQWARFFNMPLLKHQLDYLESLQQRSAFIRARKKVDKL